MKKTLSLKKQWLPIKLAPDNIRIICYSKQTGQWMTKKEEGQFPMYEWDGMRGVWYPEPSHFRYLDDDPN